jgi:hypothetical protein
MGISYVTRQSHHTPTVTSLPTYLCASVRAGLARGDL